MDEWVLWMIAAGVMAVGEILTLGFFLGPVAIAAAAAAVVAVAGGGLAAQWIVFIALSLPPCWCCDRSRATRALPDSCAPAPPHWWVARRWCSSGWTAMAARSSSRAKSGPRGRSTTTSPSSPVTAEVMKIDGATALVASQGEASPRWQP